MHGTLTERITRSLAYMLRHQPEEFDLDLDKGGWGEMEEIVCALNERLGEPIEEDDVVAALDGGDRQRYEIKDDRIRALYGHSFPVEPGDSVEPPEFLYVGVGSRDASRAEERGLRPTRRSFVHLALNEEDAMETGRRAAPEYAVLKIDAVEAWEEGIEFYDRISLFLSEEIPAEFIEVGEIQTDGIRRQRGSRDSGRGGRDSGPRRGG
ncbi:MAG: putative RNA 2'-phosphotransferase, partial [Planctomycetota bacterium]